MLIARVITQQIKQGADHLAWSNLHRARERFHCRFQQSVRQKEWFLIPYRSRPISPWGEGFSVV
ncbi:hypothetical protein KDA_51080 [Dictyobacter alpinus]|uniref:Uncharacterized protein n=1 Tax=Dictyobacter alpinus TaxID=2014873 RepID=A0A402BE19_9CHLR|nr:hypothetical protein KDA_51080 [Dictyobacter alpinus]